MGNKGMSGGAKALLAVVALALAGAAFYLVRDLGKPRLNVFTWSGYFAPEVVEAFEREYGCRVAFDIYTSNEMANTRIQNGADDYDVITPSSYMVSMWRQEDRLLPIDPALVPNAAGIDRGFLKYTEDPDMKFSVPYTRTVTGIGYNAEAAGEDVDPSWAFLADPRFKGRATMLDDVREIFAAALKYLAATKGEGDPARYDINTVDPAEIDEAVALLIEWKKNLDGFQVDNARAGLENGKYFAVQQYNGDIAQVMSEGAENVRFFVPKEGSSISSDDFVILKNTKQAELAHRFVNFMIEPDNAVKNMQFILYYMPVPAALEKLKAADPDLYANAAFNVPEELIEKCNVLRYLGDDTAKYSDAYDRVIKAP